MPSLFVIRGRDKGMRFDLTEEVIGVGRDHSNPIHLQDTEASRKHAELRRTGNTYELIDLGSANGTYVNGQLVSERELASGDQILFGKTAVIFTAAGDQTADELAQQINIITAEGGNDESRILRSMSQQEGSAIFDPGVDDSRSPWLARARSNLQIMYRTALAVSHTLDIDQLLSRIMDLIFEWVEADRGCIMLFDHETRKLRSKVYRHRRKNADDRLRISQSIIDYVVSNNEGVLTSNAKEDDRWNAGQSILQSGIREAICVPMQGRYDVVGIVYIDTAVHPLQMAQAPSSPGGNKFSEEHLKLMVAIGHQAALAVEDTQYYRAMVQAERLAAVGQTVATLSHHVKNVLQGIRGGSYLIELGLKQHKEFVAAEEPDMKKVTAAAAMIEKGWGIVDKNQEKISTLVLDMLTFSKERDPEPAPSNINQIVGDIIELMQQRAKDLDVEVVWKPQTNIPTLMFDPDGLHRAVLNIVTNAIDACDQSEHGRVEVTTEYNADHRILRIVVVDNGSGIDPDDLENIFSLFVSKKGGRGTGLGLSVSQKILKEHGGRIHVESQVGKGSRFALELPALQEHEKQPDDSSSHRPTMSLDGSDLTQS